ncbi:hypothetical protein ACPA9J_22425 [Pseudomonas aeruginosa]
MMFVGLGGFADQQVMVDTQSRLLAADHHVVLEEAVEGWLTAPSVEFSTGTTPKFTAPAATSVKHLVDR